MSKRVFNAEAKYQSIKGASRITGLAQGFIREGCKNGSIPCFRAGREYRVDMELFLKKLESDSLSNCNAR